jgi:hypothetical protein
MIVSLLKPNNPLPVSTNLLKSGPREAVFLSACHTSSVFSAVPQYASIEHMFHSPVI